MLTELVFDKLERCVNFMDTLNSDKEILASWEKSIKNSSSEFFFLYYIPNNFNKIHSRIYDDKELLLGELHELPDKLSLDELRRVDIYEAYERNIFNDTNTENGHTNLSLLKKFHDTASTHLRLHFGDSYVLDNGTVEHDKVNTVSQLIDKLYSWHPYEERLIYPTTGNEEDGTLKFVPSVKVYYLHTKLY